MTPPMMPLSSGAAPTQTQFTLAQMPATAPSLTRQVSAAVGAGSLQRVPALTSAGAFAPGVKLLLQSSHGFVPRVSQAQAALSGALKQLDDALPPAPSVHRALARLSPAQKTVVANTALLLLDQHQRGQLNVADFRAALQQLLNDGAGIQVGTPAGAAGASSGAPSPLKWPRLQPLPEQGLPALAPRLRPTGQAQRGGAAAGPVLPPEIEQAIERLRPDRSAVFRAFLRASDLHLTIEGILDAIRNASPQQLGALLRELAELEPGFYDWLIQQDFFVEAIGQRLDVSDLPRALDKIPAALNDQLRTALKLDRPPNGRDLLATMLCLAHERGALEKFKDALPAVAPSLHDWLQEQPWFSQVLNWGAGLAPSAQLMLTVRNERGQPVRADALPAYGAGSSLHLGYLKGAGGTQRLFVVPGADATVDGAPAPGRVEAGEDPLAALVKTVSGQSKGSQPMQLFTASVTRQGLLQMVGNTRPGDDAMQAIAETTRRPVLRPDGAAAAPLALKQQLKSTGFVFSHGASADRLSEDIRLTHAVVRLGEAFGVDALPTLLDSVRGRLPADDALPETNLTLADFMRVMQHDSTPEAQRLAAESLTEKLGLASPRRNDEKRARALLDEVTQYVGKYGVDSLRWDDSRLDTQLQHSREARWLRAATSELLHRAEARSLVDVIALYYRELLDFAAPHRR